MDDETRQQHTPGDGDDLPPLLGGLPVPSERKPEDFDSFLDATRFAVDPLAPVGEIEDAVVEDDPAPAAAAGADDEQEGADDRPDDFHFEVEIDDEEPERPRFSFDDDPALWSGYGNEEEEEPDDEGRAAPAPVPAPEDEPETEEPEAEEPKEAEPVAAPATVEPETVMVVSAAPVAVPDEEPQEEAVLPYVAARRGIFAMPAFHSIISARLTPDYDEMRDALSAFGTLEEGQSGLIRYSIRAYPGFRDEAQNWISARKAGADPTAKKKGVFGAIYTWGRWTLSYMWFLGVKDGKYLGGGAAAAPPRKPGERGKPIPISQQSDDEVQAMDDAKRKAKESVFYETALRIAVVGDSDDKAQIEMVADHVTAGFDAYRNNFQWVEFQNEHGLDAVRGYMPPKPEPLMIVSAAELGELAKPPDDTTHLDGVQMRRSKFKYLPLHEPLVILDPYNPPPGLIPVGVINKGTADEKVIGIRNDELDKHFYMQGKTGSGKSELMKWLVFGVAKADYPIVVIDPHGACSEDILSVIIRNVPERAKDIVYVNLGDKDFPVALNPLDVRHPDQVEGTVNAIKEMLHKFAVDQGNAPRATNYIEQAITALCEANLHLRQPDTKCTLLDVAPFFTNADFRQAVVQMSENDNVQESFGPSGQFETLGEKQKADHVATPVRAFQQLGNSTSFAAVFNSPENKLNFAKLLTAKSIVLVKIPRFGTQSKLGEFVASLMLPWLLSTADEWGKNPETGIGIGCRVFVDEAPRLLTPESSIIQILAELRKWDLGLVAASQYSGQMDRTVAQAILANANSKLALGLEASSAREIATAIAGGDKRMGAAEIADLPNYHYYANLLLPGGPSGLFSAACLDPIKDELDDKGRAVRQEIIERSRKLVANKRSSQQPPSVRRKHIMAVLGVKHNEDVDSITALEGRDFSLPPDEPGASGDGLW